MKATGIIHSYDPEDGTGYIDPDDSPRGEDKLPFDADDVEGYEEGEVLQEGQRVRFTAQGGLAGVFAVEIQRI